jgi:DNA mismatch endonuclease Vsr
MTDKLPTAVRSALMARIRRGDTKPEMTVRRLLYRLGYRYRIHFRDVPGRPDVAFTRKRKAVLINGCFWHAHEGCAAYRLPKTRVEFWRNKFAKNRERDARLLRAASDAGWATLVLWECEINDLKALSLRLRTFLGRPRSATRKR